MRKTDSSVVLRYNRRLISLANPMKRILLKPGREKSLLRRHPWIFSGAIARECDAAAGETISVCNQQGTPLAIAAWSPHSQIRARIWSFDPEQTIDRTFFRQRIAQALQQRREWLADPAGASRLVNTESDGLPGLIVDRYADYLVCQFLATGVEYWRDAIVEALQSILPCRGIHERSDADIRNKEGLPPRSGKLSGEPVPERVRIHEAGLYYCVDIQHGHKTGFYLDQRENRLQLAPLCHEAEVLNAFAYTGGFGLRALQGGARHVLNIDSSEQALALLNDNIALNGLDANRSENLCEDVFSSLRRLHREGRQFDIVVLDPPKFVDSKANLTRASRGYKDINRLAFMLLRTGGYLLTFSCSGLLNTELFQKIVADAALDANRTGAIVHHFSQAADHPIRLSFPEGGYLKGLLVRVVE